jgi:hypothetical protein
MVSSGIFAIETTQWWRSLRDRSTVRPILDLISHGTEGGVDYVHRQVATPEELRHHVRRWRRTRFPILFLAMHGRAGVIFLDNRKRTRNCIDLDGLAEMLGDGLAGRIVHFGCCSTLDIDKRNITRFLRRTGVTAATGFASDLDWLRSGAFELLVLSTLLRYRVNLRGARRMEQVLMREVPCLRRELAFRMVINEP